MARKARRMDGRRRLGWKILTEFDERNENILTMLLLDWSKERLQSLL